MLKVIQEFGKITATDGNIGNINVFLKRLLIEVVTANYKQMLNETLVLSPNIAGRNIKLDPPLRANENVMSGLFNNGISAVADRYRPEVLIQRPVHPSQVVAPIELFDDIEDFEFNSSDSKNTGHVDFLAWYDKRCIAIELKRASMDCITLEKNDTLVNRWDKVVKQTKEAQDWLRGKYKENHVLYPNPISIGLMVVVGRCAFSRKNDEKKNVSQSDVFASSLGKLPNRPGFIATYDFPIDFQEHRKFNSESDKHNVHVPYVAFIATSKINQLKS
jgi:hypothetical protein